MPPTGRAFAGRFFAAFASACAALLEAAPASANGRYPAASQLVISPSDPNSLLLRATFGFLLSRDGGATWDWICEQAVGYAGEQDPAIGVTASGSLLSGAFEGLSVSLDRGCTWSLATGGLRTVVDLTVVPGAPHEALALTNAFSGTGDAGNLYESKVDLSTDDGAHWGPIGLPLDPSLVLVTIESAPSDRQRVYVSGHRGAKDSGAGVLLVSMDGGLTFGERAVPLDANESDPYIAAVDPTNADLVYLRTAGTSTGRLLVTADAGKTLSVRYTGGAILGFALSPDGAKVYLGGSDGLQVASTADYTFRQTSTVPVQCLRAGAGVLYVCSDELAAGFTLGRSRDDGATIEPTLHLAQIRGPLACPPATSTVACKASWPALEQQLGIPGSAADAGFASDASIPPSDASLASDAPADAGDAGAPSSPLREPRGGCTCDSVGARTEGPSLWTVLAAALLLAEGGCRRNCRR
jgi:hypothetical protein